MLLSSSALRKRHISWFSVELSPEFLPRPSSSAACVKSQSTPLIFTAAPGTSQCESREVHLPFTHQLPGCQDRTMTQPCPSCNGAMISTNCLVHQWLSGLHSKTEEHSWVPARFISLCHSFFWGMEYSVFLYSARREKNLPRHQPFSAALAFAPLTTLESQLSVYCMNQGQPRKAFGSLWHRIESIKQDEAGGQSVASSNHTGYVIPGAGEYLTLESQGFDSLYVDLCCCTDMNSNNSLTDYFEFTVFSDYGSLKYVFFSLCLLIYMTIISANVVIILTVCLDKKSSSKFRGKALQTCLPHMKPKKYSSDLRKIKSIS
ncbi:hypothetical protein Q8A73_009527 [Channa argus]|nr:hypothetical protein Q8A73_009527 [Channa argus]